MDKKLKLIILSAVVVLGVFAFFRFSPTGTEMLWNLSNQGTFLLPLIMVAALIDSINPCAFSILLLTIAFLLSLKAERSRVVLIAGTYIFGLFVVYILIGLGIIHALHLFNTPHFMAKVGSGILIAWGAIELINVYFPNFPLKLRIPGVAHARIGALMNKASIPTAFALGILVGLCEFPCTGGPYLMVLGLLHDQVTYYSGLGYLLLYNLIFILPLVIILALTSTPAVLGRMQAWRKSNLRSMKVGGGIAMIALGILMLML